MDAKELFEFFLKVKKENNLITYDTHVHPFDVLGSHKHHQTHPHSTQIPPHSLLERLEYNKFSLSVLKLIFRFVPSIVRQSIRTNFMDACEARLLTEMEESGIDRAALIPVEPFVGALHINEYYTDPCFLHVGSVNIHALTKEDIAQNIENQINQFSIIGLKLHPNIQGFFPEPDRNQKDLAEKLREVYRIAKEKKLYLLFHGGLSHLLHTNPTTVQYGFLKNFFAEDETSELFSFGIPTIIAHLGHYNLSEFNIPLLKRASAHPHILFDTSGTGSRLIKQALEIIGSQKIIFGSDANYFRIKFNVGLVLKAIVSADIPESVEERIQNIFGKNFEHHLTSRIM